MAAGVEFKVVGMSFVEGYPDNLLQLHQTLERRAMRAIQEGEDPARVPVRLVRNPANPADANAIEVHIPLVGRASMVGHVPRHLAARIAPSMDKGDEWYATIDAVLIEPRHPDRPGVSIYAERAPSSA